MIVLLRRSSVAAVDFHSLTKMVRARRVRVDCCSPKRKTAKITHFFHNAPTDGATNDLDDVGKEEYKVLPDIDGDTPTTPVTPHRIELRDENAPQMAPHAGGDDVKENGGCVRTTTLTGGKTRRRLNTNQSSNQQTAQDGGGVSVKQKSTLTDYFPVRRSVRKTKKTVLEEKQRTLEENVRRGVEDGLRVHHFGGDKGRGVVAARRFARGDFVVEYAGDLIDMQEARRRETKYAMDQNAGCYMYYFKHANAQYCIDATAETGRLGRLVNHARNGNLITRVINVGNQPRLVLVAKDAIQVGDEVCYDYGDRSKESLAHHPWLAN